MGDTDILVDSDTMDQKLEEKVSSDNCKGGDLRDSADETNVPDGQGDQKLEKVILLPEGNALQFKSVKIEVEVNKRASIKFRKLTSLSVYHEKFVVFVFVFVLVSMIGFQFTLLEISYSIDIIDNCTQLQIICVYQC